MKYVYILILLFFCSFRLRLFKTEIKPYVMIVHSTIASHVQAWKQLVASEYDWAILAQAPEQLPLHVYGSILAAPPGWQILQVHFSDPYLREHHKNLRIPWVHWLPHHSETFSVYAIQKNKARALLNQPNVTDLTMVNVLGVHAYTLTHTKKTWRVLGTRLLIITVVVLNSEKDMEKEFQQLIREYNYMQQFYTISPQWIVSCVLRHENLSKILATMISPLKDKHIEFHVATQTETFSKWLYVIPHTQTMKAYTHVLYKDFDQLLLAFDWPTFMMSSPDTIIRSVVRESLIEAKQDGDKRAWFQVNDAQWWRHYETQKWRSIQPDTRPFVEMYFVLFQAEFASWFFNTIFARREWIDARSDWGPDFMWCGAAKTWSNQSEPCAIIPITSYHVDTRKIRQAYWSREDRMMPVERWNRIFPMWMNFSLAWREKWGGIKQWTYEH